MQRPNEHVDRLLTDKEGAALLSISRPTFRRRVREGMLPPPLKLGFLSRWPQSELLAVVEKAKAARFKG